MAQPAQQPLQPQRSRASRTRRRNQWIPGELGQLTPPYTQEVFRTIGRDGAGFWVWKQGPGPILPSLRGRKGRFSPTPNPESQNPGDTFKPCRFLVPHSGKGNRKSWVKKKSAHPLQRDPPSGQCPLGCSGTLEPGRRSNGGTLVLRKAAQLGRGGSSLRPN